VPERSGNIGKFKIWKIVTGFMTIETAPKLCQIDSINSAISLFVSFLPKTVAIYCCFINFLCKNPILPIQKTIELAPNFSFWSIYFL
jgi:hypothetical protein